MLMTFSAVGLETLHSFIYTSPKRNEMSMIKFSHDFVS